MNRIEKANGNILCDVITLTEGEKDLYHGSGYALAKFVDDYLQELVYFTSFDDEDDAIDQCLNFGFGQDNVYLVMCSCYELCDPHHFITDDASSLAKLKRLIGATYNWEYD